MLLIPSAVLEKYIPAYDLLEFHVDMHPEHPVDVTRLERIKKIFTDMYIVYDVRPDAYLLKFNSLLYDLLYTLVHSYSILADGPRQSISGIVPSTRSRTSCGISRITTAKRS